MTTYNNLNEDVKNLSTDEIAKKIKQEAKALEKEYGKFKLSCRTQYYSGGSSIDIAITELSFIPFNTLEDYKNNLRYEPQIWEDLIKSFISDKQRGYMNINQYYVLEDKRLNKKARELLDAISRIESKYNYNNSDAMIDYFDVNFYTHYSIGKFDKPLKILEEN